MNRDPSPTFPLRRFGRVLPARVRAHAALLAVGLAVIGSSAMGDRTFGQPRDAERPHRDVTVVGLRAEPSKSRIDPALSPFAAPLRKLLPDHGLTLLDAESRRLAPNEAIGCELDAEHSLKVTLLKPLGADGKVLLRVQLFDQDRERPVFVTDVRTPADQLVFLDKRLPGTDDRLLIGIGAR